MEIAPMTMQVLDARRDPSGGYRVDVSRGQRVGRVSSEWFSRPADERYLSLNELARSVRDRADRSRTRVVESALIHVEANRADPERLALMLPGSDTPAAPTHWSFGQLASQVGAPAAYLRQLPAALAGINLQYGLTANRAEQIKTLETDDGRVELRAVTSPDYGRIFDHELVEAVQRIAGNGTGDTRWKVPGVLDWSTEIYNPRVDISKDTTTLYASDIARRSLLQSLNVRPISDAEGQETGMFEVPAGGRRYRALELLVKQKRLAKTAPVPCIVSDSTEITAEEDSLAENVHRVALHPLDQFRAFQTLREKGRSEEDIAAIFFVSVNVVKQRLRLAAVSPTLLDVYADDGMSLEQLMAFSVTAEHARQEQVWESVNKSGYDEPYQIRRLLTERAVRASDKRARFVGLPAYEAAGGNVLRDLFEEDGGGWLEDVALLERLVADRLRTEAEAVAAEGWKWLDVAASFPYAHDHGLRRLEGTPPDLTSEEQVSLDALQAEYDELQAKYEDADELPDEVDARLGELEEALAVFENRPDVFNPSEIVHAGAFVSIDGEGGLHVERGYVRRVDETAFAAATIEPDSEASATAPDADGSDHRV